MSLRSLTAAACGAAAGLGVWATLGSIDRMLAPSGAVRVAMLPSLGTLAASVAAGALLCIAWHLAVTALAHAAAAREWRDGEVPGHEQERSRGVARSQCAVRGEH